MRDTDPNLTEAQNEYVSRVIEECNATKYRTIAPGLTHLCDDCCSAFGIADDERETFELSIQNGSVCDEGGFSWHDCEVCHSHLGGNRYAAHAFADDDSILHYEICEDCLCYLANGDVPERPA